MEDDPTGTCVYIIGTFGGFCDWFLPQRNLCVSQAQFPCRHKQCDNVRSGYLQPIILFVCSHIHTLLQSRQVHSFVDLLKILWISRI